MAETLKITSLGQGIPLVFIHGWGLNSGIWQPLAKKLATKYKVITVDLPGYGINHNYEVTPYSIENIAKAVVDAVQEPAIYLGWSLGGLVATQIASEYQKDILALVTIASSPFFLEQRDGQDEVQWPGIKPALLSAFHQQLAKDPKKTIDGFLKIQAMGSPHIRQDLKEIKALIFQYNQPSRAVLDQSLILLETVDLRATLSQLTLPFLRIYGRLDSLVPKTTANFVSEYTPTSECFVFQHASHAPFISDAEEFHHRLDDWLKTLACLAV